MSDLVHDRDAAWALLTEHTKGEALLRHALAVEASVRAYARRMGADETAWGNVALLHDFDYEMHPTLDRHPQDGAPILRERGYPEWFVRAILSHADHLDRPRETPLERVLYACDELSGFVHACGLVRPTGLDGLEPKCIVLMIGNNNMFFVPETGVVPAAKGVKACFDNLRRKFPTAPVVVAKILPAHEPGNTFYENIKKTNAALDPLKLDADKLVRVLDLTADMVNTDGTVKADLYSKDKIHLSEAGYALYAEKLRPVVDAVIADAKK